MLGRKTATSPIPTPPTQDELETFDEDGTGGPSKKRGAMLLDLEGSPTSGWNRRASSLFRRDFQKSKLYEDWGKHDIEEVFLVHILSIRQNYRKQIGRISAEAQNATKTKAARASRMKTVRFYSDPSNSYPDTIFSSFNSEQTAVRNSKTFKDSPHTLTSSVTVV